LLMSVCVAFIWIHGSAALFVVRSSQTTSQPFGYARRAPSSRRRTL
jgi:hypothetical protein